MLPGYNNVGKVFDGDVVRHLLVVFVSIDELQFIDRPAVDAEAQKYWARKRGERVDALIAEHQARADQRCDRKQARERRQKKVIEKILTQPAVVAKPAHSVDIAIGDRVRHAKSGKSFLVLEIRGDEIAVKGDNTPRMVFLRESLEKA